MECILFLPTEINVIYLAGLNFTAKYAPFIFSKSVSCGILICNMPI